MPITGWNCPVCKRSDQALDHFENTSCGLSVHPDYAAAVLHSNDDRYTTSALTVTAGLGCPRSRALEEALNVSVNPLDYNALLIGTAWDRHLAAFAPPLQQKIVVRGQINGLQLCGEIDRLRQIHGEHETRWAIEDHKHSNNFQYKYKAKEGARLETVIQTSLYAELFAQTFPEAERPTHGVCWYHFSGGNNSSSPPLLPFVYLLWDVERCLAHKPFGGDYTVRELYEQAARFENSKNVITALDLPLSGESMAFGTASFCDYCQVRSTCMTAAKGAPF